MIILSESTDQITISLGSSVTSNELHVYASWRERTDTTFFAGRTAAETNGTTDVVVVDSPSQAIAQRVIDFISVFNYDTVAATVSIKFNDNGTDYFLWIGSLPPGDKLEYNEGVGWRQITI